MKRVLLSSVLLLTVLAHAKLPAPVMSDEAKAKAVAAAAKAAHDNKVAAYQLCVAQNKAASQYFKAAAASGKGVNPPSETPACTDPGPFVPAPVAAAPKA